MIIDREPAEGGGPLSLFESGAILLYLAEKIGRFIAQDVRGRVDVLQWLFWEMGGLGPIAGQTHHFRTVAPEKIPYAIERYVKETGRLYGVLNTRLVDREFIAGDYSIADMACYPWIVSHERQGQKLEDFPQVKRWFEAITRRPAVARAYAKGVGINPKANVPKGLAIAVEMQAKMMARCRCAGCWLFVKADVEAHVRINPTSLLIKSLRREFPCIFPWCRETDGGDYLDPDCVLSHRPTLTRSKSSSGKESRNVKALC